MPKEVEVRPPKIKVPFRRMSHKRSKSRKSVDGNGTTRGKKSRKSLKDAPEADNVMTWQDYKAIRVKYAYKNSCSFCKFKGRTSSLVAYHVGYKCKLPMTNEMIFKTMDIKEKGTFKVTKSTERDATGVSNKSVQRLFDQVKFPSNVLIAPFEYLYLWIGPRPKGKSRRCSDLRRKILWGKLNIMKFKLKVLNGIHEGRLEYVAVPVCFYPSRSWHHLIGMTHSAMILIKLKDMVNGTVQASYYDSFEATRSTMFRDRVRKGDVRLALSRIVGRSVAVTDDICWPSP
ncbi:unnamed protein product [Allacma fusca]|uniref:Uncharacterized protein n=1 Tax=Allacma fusca TaxID=39272 RepID=A0A8J2NIG2_9HEXA|nr:unnamed protein product [Allacma fusca]